MAKRKVIAGQKGSLKAKHVPLKDVVGKTIIKVESGTVEGAFGNETCVFLVFSDGTEHGFVLPQNEE